jgi:hypothetical protein
METSFNCSILSDTLNFLDTFSVNIYKDNKNKSLFAEFGNKRYNIESFKVDHLRDYICDRKNVVDFYKYTVKLWKVDVDVKAINQVSTREGLFGDEMMPYKLFRSYLETNYKNHDPEKIHIITIIPTTATGKCL